MALCLPFVLSAQTTKFSVNELNIISPTSIKPVGMIWVSHYFKESKFGLFSTGLANPTWGQLHVGANYTFSLGESSILEIGLGAGLETHPQPFRGMTYAFFQYNPKNSWKGRVQSMVDIEYGGSGVWYLGFATYNPTAHLGVGIHSQYGASTGVRLQVVPFKNIMLWGVGGWNLEAGTPGFIVGMRGMF